MRTTELYFLGDIAQQSNLECLGDGAGDLRLEFQHITQVPVIGLRPQMKPGDRIDELCGDADRAARAAHASFEDCGDVELASDRAKIFFFASERESRCA